MSGTHDAKSELHEGYADAVAWLPHSKTEQIKQFFVIYGTEDWEISWWSDEHAVVSGEGPFVRILTPVNEQGRPHPYMVGFMTALRQHRPDEHRQVRREQLDRERESLQERIDVTRLGLIELKNALAEIDSKLAALSSPSSA